MGLPLSAMYSVVALAKKKPSGLRCTEPVLPLMALPLPLASVTVWLMPGSGVSVDAAVGRPVPTRDTLDVPPVPCLLSAET